MSLMFPVLFDVNRIDRPSIPCATAAGTCYTPVHFVHTFSLMHGPRFQEFVRINPSIAEHTGDPLAALNREFIHCE